MNLAFEDDGRYEELYDPQICLDARNKMEEMYPGVQCVHWTQGPTAGVWFGGFQRGDERFKIKVWYWRPIGGGKMQRRLEVVQIVQRVEL